VLRYLYENSNVEATILEYFINNIYYIYTTSQGLEAVAAGLEGQTDKTQARHSYTLFAASVAPTRTYVEISSESSRNGFF
jgi:hypothetical protein